LKNTMLNLLDGFADDGTCMEGFSYWHYGFGNYIWFADLLRQFSDGQIDLMKEAKVEKISGYAQRSFLCGNNTVSFSDGTRQGMVNVLMQNYLAHLFPKTVYPLPAEVSQFQKMNVMWMSYFRNLYYLDLIKAPQELVKEDVDLPDAGQVIINRDEYSLAVTAGDNGEPHNHNDVGNFILATKKGQIFCDLGAGRYTRQYFDPETRYSIFCNGSQSHNVPILNGTYQMEGKEYAGTICFEKAQHRITVEMDKAYARGVTNKLTRIFDYWENGFVLTDQYDPEQESVVERFVTLEDVEVFETHVAVNGVVLRFDPAVVSVSVSKMGHENHDLSISWINCIDFAVKPGIHAVEFKFEVTKE